MPFLYEAGQVSLVTDCSNERHNSSRIRSQSCPVALMQNPIYELPTRPIVFRFCFIKSYSLHLQTSLSFPQSPVRWNFESRQAGGRATDGRLALVGQQHDFIDRLLVHIGWFEQMYKVNKWTISKARICRSSYHRRDLLFGSSVCPAPPCTSLQRGKPSSRSSSSSFSLLVWRGFLVSRMHWNKIK